MLLEWKEINDIGEIIQRTHPLYSRRSMKSYVDNYLTKDGRSLSKCNKCYGRGYLEFDSHVSSCYCVDKNMEKIKNAK